MNKILLIIIFVFLSVSTLYSFDLLMFGGFSYATPTGWSLGAGFYQDLARLDVYVTYDDGAKRLSFNVFGFIPLFHQGVIIGGPSMMYLYSDFEGKWQGKGMVGVVLGTNLNDYSFLFGTYYPINHDFSFAKDIFIELKYYLKPPKGMVFKDKLFFSFVYTENSFRFGIGLLEPIP
ncbi:MAG: hypothetical protein J7L34_00605 [Thermotogaceae bacterium]|nr:hypothetical protein [Thermotogaceae bacterium]